MRSIERFIRDELAAFVALDQRDYFDQEHGDILKLLTSEQWIAGNTWKPACEVFTDYGLVSELGQFADEFTLWARRVDEIRCQWLYDHLESELPEDYLSVFGHSSELVWSLESMLNRCRRIVRRIDDLHETKPEAVDHWPAALACLTGRQIDIVKAMRKSAGGLSYHEMVKDGLIGDLATESKARSLIRDIRTAWKDNGIPLKIPTPKRGGKLQVVEDNLRKNVTDT